MSKKRKFLEQLEENEILKESKLSMNALYGSRSLNTIKIKGVAKKRPATILMDSGSTQFYRLQGCKRTENSNVQSFPNGYYGS